jgi:hypothetical protein
MSLNHNSDEPWLVVTDVDGVSMPVDTIHK